MSADGIPTNARHLAALVKKGEGLIHYTLPGQLNSRFQKYRLTSAGRRTLKKSGVRVKEDGHA